MKHNNTKIEVTTEPIFHQKTTVVLVYNCLSYRQKEREVNERLRIFSWTILRPFGFQFCRTVDRRIYFISW